MGKGEREIYEKKRIQETKRQPRVTICVEALDILPVAVVNVVRGAQLYAISVPHLPCNFRVYGGKSNRGRERTVSNSNGALGGTDLQRRKENGGKQGEETRERRLRTNRTAGVVARAAGGLRDAKTKAAI